MKDKAIYNLINEEIIINYQNDTIPMNKKDFSCVNYNFLGSYIKSPFDTIKNTPFTNYTPKGYAINGGLSYRVKSIFIEVIDKVSSEMINTYRIKNNLPIYYYEMPEDAFFYHGLEILNYEIPNKNICNNFFCQDYIDMDLKPFGYHGTTFKYIDCYVLLECFKKSDIYSLW